MNTASQLGVSLTTREDLNSNLPQVKGHIPPFFGLRPLISSDPNVYMISLQLNIQTPSGPLLNLM